MKPPTATEWCLESMILSHVATRLQRQVAVGVALLPRREGGKPRHVHAKRMCVPGPLTC